MAISLSLFLNSITIIIIGHGIQKAFSFGIHIICCILDSAGNLGNTGKRQKMVFNVMHLEDWRCTSEKSRLIWSIHCSWMSLFDSFGGTPSPLQS